MAREKVDIITCDRCARRLEEEDVRMIEFTIFYQDSNERNLTDIAGPPGRPDLCPPAPSPTRYVEVCKRCDTLLRKLAEQARPPSKPGRKKEKEDGDAKD